MRWIASWVAAGLLAAGASSALGAVGVFNVNMTGAKEVAAGMAGDLDGSAVGTITVDSTLGKVTWSLTLSNLATPSDFHIHGPAGPTQTASVLVPLGVPAGSLVGNTFSASINTSAPDTADLVNVLANPGNFYFNIHNGDFPGGAVRDQVPEPAGLTLIGLAAVAMMRRRRA